MRKNKRNKWSNHSIKLIKELHEEIAINERTWHQYKSNSDRRAAELIISALGQLINDGESKDIQELLQQSIKWLKKEISDPGCPDH